MKIEFRLTEEDYKKFLNSYFLKRNISIKLTILIIISFYIGSFRQSTQPFMLSTFLLKVISFLILLGIVIILIPYLNAKVNINKTMRANFLTETNTIELVNEGIITSNDYENSLWKWETISKAEINNGYLYIILYTNKFFLIPINAFYLKNEPTNFLGVIKTNIHKLRDSNKYRKVKNLHYWGLFGILPNFGVIAGIVLIIKGLIYKTRSLILVGLADILFTFFFWIVIFPLTTKTNGFKEISQMQLNSLVKNIEFYKLQNGHYPDNLQQLLKDDKLAPINDVLQHNNLQNSFYNYKRIGDKYLLYSSGMDGIPNTDDDFYPKIKSNDSSKIGLLNSR